MNDITVLHFDRTYHASHFLHDKAVKSFDVTGISNTNLFCERESLREIERLIGEAPISPITFLGSGNYHYVSYLLLARIQTPFTLILFDHHTDALPSPSDSLISCGSWVLEALQQLPFLQKVVMLGVHEDWEQYIPLGYQDKIVAYSKNTLQAIDSNFVRSILEHVPTDQVYISIDKDVLDKRQAVTAWDHGTMLLTELLQLVTIILNNRELVGLDICGEYPITPTNAFNPITKDAIRKNTGANEMILKSVLAGIQSETVVH
ncbi:arginase family protein [Ornithinibacillus contaminans]|uniref:arginase family protein n=1 Tax=Ornithinibacillus contaminans TaxID=694055 RepID=UPI00064DDE14|nr:arginase family protein [Ornithinibacillus contaminans]